MSETSLQDIIRYGTNAQRLAFTPTPFAGQPLYIWYETDTGNTYIWDGSAWTQIAGAGSTPPPAGGSVQTSFLVSGGSVVWIQDYDFTTSPAQYYIQGILYSSPQTDITLDPADATDDRIDIIVVDDSNSVIKITGIPASNPSEPAYDPGTQLKVAIIIVPAASTEPTGVSNEIIYYDNAGGPTEWNWTDSGTSFDVNSTNNPKSPSTKDIELTTAVAGDYAQGDIPSSSFDPNTASQLVLSIRSKATWGGGRGLTISLRNNGALVGTAVNINRTGSFGFISSSTTDYQQLGIPISNFAIPAGSVITQVRIAAFGNGFGCYIDDIFFQINGASQGGSSGISQTEADARYLQRANNLSDLTSASSATAQLSVMVGDSGAGGTKGLVPAPAAGDAAAGKFLKADGTFDIPTGSGINQLTGDVTAGPGSGSQAATLANTAVTPSTYGNASNVAQITVDSKGRITGAANVPVSGGSGGSGVVERVTVSLDNAQILSLNTVPVDVVPAPGANLAVFLLGIYNSTDFSAGVYSNVVVRTRYAGGTTDLTATYSNFLNQATVRGNQLPLTAVGFLASEFTNKAIQISAASNPTGGNAANSWKCTIVYITMPVL